MTTDTRELDALAAAMNRSARRLQTLWFTFLGVTLYFAISALTTTHRMLFLEEGQALPILNVKLPLLPFYVISPAFYLLLHAYVLMMLVLLARTARTFEDALNAPDGLSESERERYRMRLDNALFLQIIVGAKRERSGANGFALRVIALTTLAVAPVLLLLLFQLMFLPYHSEVVTWWHRLLVVADLAIVWTLWPSYRREWGERMGPRLRPIGSFALRSLAVAAVVAFSFFMATFPSERMNEIRLATAMDDRVFGASAREGLFPNRLWLPREDFVDDGKLKRLIADNTNEEGTRPAPTVDLGGRNLVRAHLPYTDLRGASFKDADMAGADLTGAWLTNANFNNTRMQSAVLLSAELQDANLVGAWMQASILREARLYGARLALVRLAGVDLNGALLQGALLHEVSLVLADLGNANLQGATLLGGLLYGTVLDNADLRGASIVSTSVWRVRGTPRHLDSVLLSNLKQVFECAPGKTTVSDCQMLLDGIPPGASSEIQRRFAELDPRRPAAADMLTTGFWDAHIGVEDHGSETLAHRFEQIVCSAAGAPYVARTMIAVRRTAALYPARSGWPPLAPNDVKRIVSRLKNAAYAKPNEETDCPGGRGLTIGDIDKLEALLPRE